MRTASDLLRQLAAFFVAGARRNDSRRKQDDRFPQGVGDRTAEDWRTMLAEGHALVNAWLAGRELSNSVEMVEESRRMRDEELTGLL